MIVVCFSFAIETLGTLERLKEERKNEREGGDENRKEIEGGKKEKEKERERVT